MRDDSNSLQFINDIATATATALIDLKTDVAKFLDLEAIEPDAEEFYHLVLANMHAICAGIVRCEAVGIGRDTIVNELREVREMHAASPFVRRLQEWPRGYPGDFETVERIWTQRNDAAPGSVAWYCENYALSRPIAQQHRNKVHHQAARILKTLIEHPRTARVFSIACGGCPDLRLIADHLSLAGEVWLNDSDADALAFAMKSLKAIGDRCHVRQGNAMRIVAKAAREGLSFDLVLAGGLFDYLPDTHARYLIKQAYATVAPGGVFYFTNIARGNPYRTLIEYFGDWFLIERSEEEVLTLCAEAGIAPDRVAIRREESGLALLIAVEKHSD